jgi:UDP-N-acetylglucosamine diphosphorylase / glucose-1-phosphate thymidylyltransferase / UDP-N-acetylgalactosamine diphosphorylase / glucosamine-1-phosphate N-acetyltransferase / galactosamine-1-phosphate N-acetyltransferase
VSAPLLVLRDDATARGLAPLATARAWGTLPAGALPPTERWATALPGHRLHVLASAALEALTDADCPGGPPDPLPAGTVLAESRAVVALAAAPTADAWTVDGRVAALRLPAALSVAEARDVALEHLLLPGAITVALHGTWTERAWDALGLLDTQLAADLDAMIAQCGGPRVPAGVTVLGTHAVHVAADSRVEPYVVIDASSGPVLIEAGAQVAAFTRLAGPLRVGAGTQLLGGRIGGSVLGPQCRIHGDVQASVFAGFANKAHEGFVGHSIVGRWANLGAGTTTSNLKNSYGSVRVWTPAGRVDTGRRFLGALIADHAKLGIGTMLTTGSVVGVGAQVFGTGRPPAAVPPFAWGDGATPERVTLAAFLEGVARVFARRDVPLTEARRAALSALHAARSSDGA